MGEWAGSIEGRSWRELCVGGDDAVDVEAGSGWFGLGSRVPVGLVVVVGVEVGLGFGRGVGGSGELPVGALEHRLGQRIGEAGMNA